MRYHIFNILQAIGRTICKYKKETVIKQQKRNGKNKRTDEVSKREIFQKIPSKGRCLVGIFLVSPLFPSWIGTKTHT